MALVLLALGSPRHTSTSSSSVTHRPDPPQSYAEAVRLIAKQERIDSTAAIKTGHSVFLNRGRRTPWAAVLLHGFANSPEQFRGVAESLYAAGSNVWVPRLPYHAAQQGAGTLSRLKAEDLCNAAGFAADIGAGLGDSVVVVGFSMGGVAAAWIAQYRPDIQRVVIVSPALALGHVPMSLGSPLVSALLRLPNITHRLIRDPRRTDRELGWSTHAVAQILRLGLAIKLAAEDSSPSVQDVRLLLNAHDRTINSAAGLALARRWAAAGAKVTVYQLSDSLRLPHDIIDATEPTGNPAVVYPILRALARGEPLPGWIARLRIER